MSKFFKALAQAERDRALLNGATPDPEPRAPEPKLALPIPALAPEPAWLAPLPADEAPDGVDEHLVSLVSPATFEAEQYRALRHSIEHLHKATGLQVVAVSSPCVGDGKTLTAINLAGALAQASEARVLLIDADLRRPAVGRALGLDSETRPGLANAILNPRLPLEQLIQSRPPFNLSVIGAGAADSSPYEVLKSPRFGELLHELRQRFDYIVLDTPPLTPVQDCRVISRWVDGFLVVVAALRTPRRFVEQAMTMLERGKILGFVFNAEEDRSILGGDSHYYGGYFSPGQSPLDRRLGALRRAISQTAGSLGGRKLRR